MTSTQRAAEDVLVIGAGPAGIATAYALQQRHISYKVIDRAAMIGDTWNRLYPSLRLNTSRFYSHMPEKPFPAHYGLFPSGRQYHDYLLDFVREQRFNIQLGVDVERVSPEGDLWRVQTSAGVEYYPVVISATGIFGNPITPNIEGINNFSGSLIHSHDFEGAAQVMGERVLVVGNGPSGIDVSVAAAETAQSVHIAIRSGVKLKRRYPFGVPQHGWLLLSERLPDAWCKRIMGFVGAQGFSKQADIGLNPPAPGSGGMTGYQGAELFDAVKTGNVIPVPEPIKFDGSTITFVDGTQHDFDRVIMATGFQPVLTQYLDVELQYNPEPWQPQSICEWHIGPNGQRGWPLRDTTDHPNGRQILGHPGLYLVGTFYKGKGAMFNFNLEADIAADQIKSYLRQLNLETILA